MCIFYRRLLLTMVEVEQMSVMFEGRNAYSIAESRAREAVAALAPELAAAERGVAFDRTLRAFDVPLLGENILIGFPGGEVTNAGGSRITGAVAVIALHYLLYRGEPLRGDDWLAYRDMPGGRDFSRAFEAMSEAKLAEYFGDRPEDFARATGSLAGVPGEVGENCFLLPALPRVSLMLVLWPAYEEVGGAARILFQPSAPYYLHTEDLAALGVVAAERLIEVAP